MKILIVNTFYYPNEMGGAESSCRVLAESMVEQGHSVSVVSTTDKASFSGSLNGVSLYYLKLFNVFWHGAPRKKNKIKGILWHLLDFFNPVMGYRFYKLVKKIKPDVVHTNNIVGFSCSVWLVCKLLNIKVVHTLRDYYLKCFRSNMRKNGENCEKQCISCVCLTASRKLLSKTVTSCVGNSQFMVDSHLNSGYFDPRKNSSVIFNAWSPNYDVEAHHNHKLKVGSKNIIGFIGRVAEEKGIEVLCSAFLKLLDEEWPEDKIPYLKIAGTGDDTYMNYLNEQFKHPRIEFLGKVKPEGFYKEIDFVVVPSLWEEPLARVVFESFFFSIPVISSNKGGNPEVIEPGINGDIFNTCEQDLVECLFRCLWREYSGFLVSSYGNSKVFITERLVLEYLNCYKK